MEAANAFLSQFIVAYNEKFGVEPENPEPAFRPLDSNINLDDILCAKEERTIIEGSVFSYKGKYYQLIKNGKKAPAMLKAKLTVLSSSKINDGSKLLKSKEKSRNIGFRWYTDINGHHFFTLTSLQTGFTLNTHGLYTFYLLQ
ncbi:hypothetical protein [Thermoanaerobacter mathranii]|uniref:hypothetical protein n=1 Tax=Thermoanaerobacter mathranii TaxID=583357 RepID=UPI003D6B208E